MDYRGLLPVEIWRDIFFKIPAYWAFSSDLSDKPLVFLRGSEFSDTQARHAQSERFRLLTICKLLAPIAEELLYSEVYLRRKAIIPFTLSENTISHGMRTRRINIYLDFQGPSSQELSHLKSLASICPKVTCISVSGSNTNVQVCKELLAGWGTGLSTLYWSSKHDWDEEALFFSQLESLTSLQLAGETHRPSSYLKNPITFPKVKILNIGAQRPTLGHIKCPVLKWLSIRDDGLGNQSIVNFIKRHGSSIRGLEINRWWGGGTYEQLTHIIPSLPHLECLTLTCEALSSLPRSVSFGFILSSTLKELVILDRSDLDLISNMVQDFSWSMFPSLKRVTFVWSLIIIQRNTEAIARLVTENWFVVEHIVHPAPYP